ncbi:MAG: HEAT repeat domain-containing protein [Proteobacteria bacterium]|nr:HEAT repeat domain-containing protein [Pseudomonadota bacterium]
MADIILLEPFQRSYKQARRYATSPAAFEKDRERAKALLLSVLAQGDTRLRHPILMMLSSQGVEEAAEPLYRIMTASGESPSMRIFAAHRLAHLLGRMRDPKPWAGRLLALMEDGDPELRRLAVTSLAWEGNRDAFDALALRLRDPDPGVRSAVAQALCRLGDDRAWAILLDSMGQETGAGKKAVLFNLWRLPVPRPWLQQVYASHLKDPEPGLRLLCLALLDREERRKNAGQVIGLLCDPDPRVRRMALRLAQALPPEVLQTSERDLERMLSDPDMEIKRLALEALKIARREAPSG